jgi:predicted TPR repeat methyltransferase
MAFDLPTAFADAVEHHKAGRTAQAEQGYRRIVSAHPEAADAWHLLGILAYQGGKAADAVELISRAVELRPEEEDYRSNLGNALSSLGRSDEAIAAYQEAIRLAPGLLDARLNLGNALMRAGQLEEAAEQYGAVLEQHADHPQALNNLGTLLRAQERQDEAIACFEQALAAVPDYRDALLNLGRALLGGNRAAEAIERLEQHLQARPDDADVHALLGASLWASGHLTEACPAFERAIALKPDAELYNDLGAVRRELGQQEPARAAFANALEFDPECAAAHANLGTLHLENDPRAAVPHFERALEIDPEHAIARYSLGAAHQEFGDLDGARKSFEQVLALVPDFHPAYYNLLCIYRLRELTDEARALAARWVENAPDDATAQHFAAAYGVVDAPERCSDEYVRQEFDTFSRTYEKRLATIQYRGPGLLQEALEESLPPPDGSLAVLDAGCGTGLCAPVLAPYAMRLVGVDLSEGMLEKADGRGYDELVAAELTAYLGDHAAEFALIVSGDTLLYFGALEPVAAAASRALTDGGHLAFTVERLADGDAGPGYELTESGRYRHSPSYVRRALEDAGFTVPLLREATVRMESSQAVTGLVVLARKSSG